MTRITQIILVDAVIELERMGQQAQMRLADEIYARQPTLLGAVVVLRRFGVNDDQLAIALHVLFVTWLAMKRCEVQQNQQWPVISEDDYDVCLQRLTARVRFTEGLSPALQEQAIKQQTDDYGERYLLAFAFGHLRDHGVLEVKTEAQKQLMLSTLGIVECVTNTAPRIKR
jgi:hypothetical protein